MQKHAIKRNIIIIKQEVFKNLNFHRYREQTSGYQWGAGGAIRDREFRSTIIVYKVSRRGDFPGGSVAGTRVWI